MAEDALSAGVGKTALGMAAVRAYESRRADRLFHDPYAEAFLRAAPDVFSAGERAAVNPSPAADGTSLTANAILRTRFFDDYLLEAVGAGPGQVVLLAAGLDTRAYRLTWPDDVTLYELDLAGVLQFKDRILSEQRATPRCRRTPIAVDLRGDWAERLTDAGFQPGHTTAWLAEGLLIYLSAQEAGRLLTSIGALSGPGDRLAFEYRTPAAEPLTERMRQLPAMAAYTAMWQGGLPDTAGWLGTHGWDTMIHDGDEYAELHGRRVRGRSTVGFLTARRRPS